MHYLYLVIAIVAEVIATSSLKATERFTRPLPSLIVLVGYGLAFVMLGLVVEKMPIGIVYAVWSGAGIVLLAIVGVAWLKQPLDVPAVIGIALILAGVVIVNALSKSVRH